MNIDLNVARRIRDDLYTEMNERSPRIFNSHEFIERYIRGREQQQEYIEALFEYRDRGDAFQTVHRIMGRFLADHHLELQINDVGVNKNLNVFGNLTDIHEWEFTD